MPSSKNIAVFCDGTWQQLDQAEPTNVSRLACAVAPFDDNDLPQVVRYDAGVGVWSGDDLAAELVSLGGGAFGNGLEQKVIDAYEFICLNYVPGDRIYIFGFSRGAYTARSLAGLLNLVWVLRRERIVSDPIDPKASSGLSQARQIYHDPRRVPGNPKEQELKSFIQNDWEPYYCHPRSQAFIEYVGVWDTVGELGIPRALLFSKEIDAKYEFYDTSLSSLTRSARHAVSIDEHRETYSPTLWTNIETLNKDSASKPYADRPYQQRWFAGYHSGVGGGQADQGLSNSAFKWIAQGAQRAGLKFDPAILDMAKENPIADFVTDPATIVDEAINLIGGTGPRMPGPSVLEEVSEAALLRWRSRRDYRPQTLSGVSASIARETGIG